MLETFETFETFETIVLLNCLFLISVDSFLLIS